jgi:bifunctional non-homologous end joining protein LigD
LQIEQSKTLEREKLDMTRFPDFIVMDFDPYIYSGKEAPGDEPELNRNAFKKASEIALSLKEILDSLKMSAFIKTSGKTGLHIYIPILREFKFDAVRSAAETLSRFLLERHPRDVTLDWQVEKRTGRIFIDYNQNVRGKRLAAPYSPRAVAGAPVSVPLEWSELGKVYPSDFNILNAPERFQKIGDLWAGLNNAKNDLKGLINSKN